MNTALTTVDADLPALFELSKHLVDSGFLPEHIRKPGQAVAIILAGRELGMPPMRALRSLMLVKGKVEEGADSQLGRFKEAGGKATFLRLEDTGAELKLVHPNGDEHVEQFTIADAKRAGLTSNATWTKYPRAMLRSRCITAGLKSVGWDGAAGAYDPDETREIAGPRAVEAAPTVQMPRRLSEKQQPEYVVSQEEPQRELVAQVESDDAELERLLQASLDLQREPVVEPESVEPAPVISEKQRRMLHAAAKAQGHDHEAIKKFLARRGVRSSKDIRVDQFDGILRRLESPEPLEA